MKISLAQIKPTTGDLEGNVRKIVEDIRKAKKEGSDIIVFPETAITGYCSGAMFEQKEFINYNKLFLEEVIAKEVPKDMVAVVGFVDYKGQKKNGNMNITNSAAIIQDGKIVDIYDKILLANGNHHEDKKYFTEGNNVKVTEVTLNGEKIKLGTPICEDAWYNDHDRDIVQEMKDKGADLILIPNYSYFFYGKQEDRRELFSNQAREKNIPIVSVNTTGIGDIVKNIMIYDGGSLAYDAKGNPVAELDRFKQDFKTVEIDLKKETTKKVKYKDWNKYEEIYEALKFEQKEIFDALGIKKAQVHMSGGIDSAVVGAIVTDSMGKDNTIFITNPTEDNSETTKGFAQYISDQLGVHLYWNSTQEPYKSVIESHKNAFGEEPTLTGKACIQATLRTVQGIGAYHTFKSGIVAAGNHTEIVLGWSTFHDIGSIGVHSLIGDLTKIEVFEMAEYINNRDGKEIIPKVLYNGQFKPAAELADAKEDPIDYYVTSGICAEMIRNRKGPMQLIEDYSNKQLTEEFFPLTPDNQSVYERYDEDGFMEKVFDAYHKARNSVFKAAQAAPTAIISPRSRGFSNRETILNKYQGWYDMDKIKKEFSTDKNELLEQVMQQMRGGYQ